MTETQREHYDGADEIGSDPWHILDRDNRNHWKKQSIISDHIAAVPGDRVLEVGCGHGLHAERYAQRFRYWGIDLVETLVEEADARTPDCATIEQADAMDLPYTDNAFEAVVGTAVLHHMEAPQTALREWLRVTKPNGSVTLMEPNYLFIKETLSTHLITAEQHKKNMRPWRLRSILADVTRSDDTFTLQPRIFTVPWPEAFHGLYDEIDAALRKVPLLRWSAQMLLIHIERGPSDA
jgi:ubiquinone/menaquinone biosynthesis C-methylase UbiE